MTSTAMPLSRTGEGPAQVPAIPSAADPKGSAASAAKAWTTSSICSLEVPAVAAPAGGLKTVPGRGPTCGWIPRSPLRKVPLNREEECEACHGSGAAPGSTPETCPECHGTGEIRVTQNSLFGQVVNVRTCPKCHGTGKIVTNPCKSCHGTGRVKKRRILTVKIPAGVDNGSRLRVAGEGEAGIRGGRPGDLYVYLYVKPHKFFEREGTTVTCEVPINIVQATLGAEIEVPTLYGKVKVKIPEGTQPNKILRLKGKGIVSLRTGQKGDQMVRIKVVIPTGLSDAQKDALRKFGEAGGGSINPEEKSFLNKIKDLFK